MGEVWAAERDGTMCAVKVLSGPPGSPVVEAVRREVRLGEIIADHPGVVGVRRVVEHAGALHLEMDLVHGPNLSDVLEGHKRVRGTALPTSVAVPWMAEVLRTLEWVGQTVSPRAPASFLHRDIKLANLLLDPSGLVRVTDFGIARGADTLDFQVTGTGIIKGAPRFMAPELVTTAPTDARADQFSVGAVLFELVTGEPLYDGRSMARILDQVARASVGERLERLGSTPQLAVVLSRLMRKNADDRYPDHGAAAAALDSLPLHGPGVDHLLAELLTYWAAPDPAVEPAAQGADWGDPESTFELTADLATEEPGLSTQEIGGPPPPEDTAPEAPPVLVRRNEVLPKRSGCGCPLAAGVALTAISLGCALILVAL